MKKSKIYKLPKPKCYWLCGENDHQFKHWLKVKFKDEVYFKKNDDYWDDYKGERAIVFIHEEPEWFWDFDTAARIKKWTYYKNALLELSNGNFAESNCEYFIVLADQFISTAMSQGSRCFREDYEALFKECGQSDLFHGTMYVIKKLNPINSQE